MKKPDANPGEAFTRIVNNAAFFFQWVFILIIATAIAVAAWFFRDRIYQGLMVLLDELRDLWENLFGRKWVESQAETPVDEIRATTKLTKPFAAFENPFQSGLASRMSSEDLIFYSFHALEAWGNDHGCARHPDQTPIEFVRSLRQLDSNFGREMKPLAELCNRAAYASATIERDVTPILQPIWKSMQTTVITSPLGHGESSPAIAGR